MHTMIVIGQFLIGLFFVFMAIYNFMNRAHMMETFTARKLQIPLWLFSLLVVLEGIGGLMVMFNYMQMVGAIYLILFTIVASFLLHPFWSVRGREMWKHIWVIMGNLAIIGGLLLILAIRG